MKKIVFILLLFGLMFSGCATNHYNRVKIGVDNSQSYDRLYSATLQTLNARNLTIIKNDRKDGTILAKDYTKAVTAHNLSLWFIIPNIYTITDYRTISIVINEASNGLYMSLNESTNTILKDETQPIIDDIIVWYKIFSGSILKEPDLVK
jgi:hypothetical protein